MTHQRMPVALIGGCLAIARCIAAGIVRQAVVHRFTFDRLDVSPGALWPRNPEEIEPPRWRFDALEPPTRRPNAAREAGHPAVRRPAVRVSSRPWETGS